jgi:hypothetical protein
LGRDCGEASDYERRNEALAPTASSQLANRADTPAAKTIVTPSPRPPALRAIGSTPAAERAAALRVIEARPKSILARPAKSFGDRAAAREFAGGSPAHYSASDGVKRLPLAGKYQERLSTAKSVHIGRTPVLRRGETASLNRFVFRRNDNASAPVAPQPVVAGGGGSSGER